MPPYSDQQRTEAHFTFGRDVVFSTLHRGEPKSPLDEATARRLFNDLEQSSGSHKKTSESLILNEIWNLTDGGRKEVVLACADLGRTNQGPLDLSTTMIHRAIRRLIDLGFVSRRRRMDEASEPTEPWYAYSIECPDFLPDEMIERFSDESQAAA